MKQFQCENTQEREAAFTSAGISRAGVRLKAGQEVIRVALYGKGLNAQLVSQSTCVDH